MMVRAMMFGLGIVVVLATPLDNRAMQLIPRLVGISAILPLPVAGMIAPRLRARYWREKKIRSDSERRGRES